MRGLPRACSARGGEMLVAGMLAAVGAVFVWQAALLDLGDVALPGPGFFPLVLGAALTIFATVIGIERWRSRRRAWAWRPAGISSRCCSGCSCRPGHCEMTGFDHLVGGFAVALSWKGLLYCFLGCLWGTIVGVLPGLGPLAGITLLLPLTFGLDPTIGIIMLTGIFYGAMYGGSTTSILVRIPGEAASVVTCIDGYEMARRGRAGA